MTGAPTGSVSGVLLAAGRSRRFGGPLPKQLARLDGEPLVRRAARTALAAVLGEVLVVTGHRAAEVEQALAGLAVTVVPNPAWAEGQSTSVRAGLARVAPAAGAAVFLPCDQPGLDASVLGRLVAAWRQTGAPAVVPAHRGRRGLPTLFDRSLFAELAGITGDTGGRQVLRRHPGAVVEVELGDGRPLLDVDTPEDLARFAAR
jgi:molybdenum cofactor cytidylyltransferase